jgi:signal transduction histidine kinase/DNA-binding response OmpR family regulator
VNGSDRSNPEYRVLVLAPTSKDASLTQGMLERAGVPCLCCPDLSRGCSELEIGAGTLLLAEELVSEDSMHLLTAWLNRQPPWSDLPVLLLSRVGADSTAVAGAMDRLGNVTVLERPIRVATLISAVRTALRSRRRQYETRELLANREEATAEITTLLETLPVGVYFAHDAECKRITGNRAGNELLRMSAGSNLSKTADDGERPQHFRPCRNGKEVPPHELPIQRAARGEVVRDEELDQVFADGTVLHTLLSASPLFDAAGNPRGAVAAITDITALKRAEHEREALLARLQEADRRKDEFLATLAHELRNPLAPIRNSLHILRLTGNVDPAVGRVTEMIERQLNLMVRLVDDLMEVSRITRGKIELRKGLVTIAAIVRSAVETSGPLIEAAGHRLSLVLPPEPLTVDGDFVRLSQVVSNLLNNAAKYTESSGEISVTVRRENGSVAIAVRDTGLGISAEMLPRVFDLFTQVDRTVARAQGGLGIGLTLVKSLTEMHGGSVEARSEGIGLGSEFVVRLPLTEAHSKLAEPIGAELASALGRRRILVVDDNRDAATSLGKLLELLGVEVRVAFNGPDALAAIDEFRPAVVLLDIGMPGMDGYEVARRVRRRTEFRGTALVALTGWGQEEDRRRSREAGFDHHMTKPADLNALQVLIGSIGGS